MAVPPLNPFVRITDDQGRPTPDFMQWWTAQLAQNDIIVPLSTPAEVSAVLDLTGATHGDLLFRGASIWDTLGPGTAGFVLATGGPAAAPVWVTLDKAFTDLTDTPSAYTGAAGQAAVVNAGETALEFADLTTTFLALTDTPSTYTGQGGRIVAVNAGATALEFIATAAQVTTLTTQAAAFSITNTLLEGLNVAQTTFATAGNVTVPSGLTGTEPMEVVWVSGARPVIVAGAGVSIISPDGARTLRAPGSWAKLTPRGSDNYLLWGDLTVGVGNGKLLLLQGDFSGNLSLQGDAASGISYLVLEGV